MLLPFSFRTGFLLLTILLTAANGPGQASSTAVRITTNDWLPYINPEGEPMGSAARIIEMIGIELDLAIEWKYMPWDLAYYRVKTAKSTLSFPYLKTEQRETEVLFSKPLFQVKNRLYYNRQFTSAKQAEAQVTSLRKGTVAGYSYGDQIDGMLEEAVTYNAETDALLALFSNEIDLLPMTESVMKVTLNRYFPHRTELIQEAPGIGDVTDLHLIASDTEHGRQLIETFDAAYQVLDDAGISALSPVETTEEPRLDKAILDVSEGYPVIIGKDTSDEPSYYTLPKGTRVIVIEWSEKMTARSSTDRIYNNMMDMSRVVVLNGPLVGKELWIRNMHIQLQ